MEEDIHSLEKEKLRLENQKLQREIELNYDQQLLNIEKRKLTEEENRQKRDLKRSLAALYLTAFSILVSAVITIFSFVSTRNINEATNKINEETLLQTKLERIDKLKSEFDDSLTSVEHKSSIAFELIRDTLLLSGYDRERFIRFYTLYQLADNTRKEIGNNEGNIKPGETEKLVMAEIRQVEIENKLREENNPTERKRLEAQIDALTGNLNVTPETRKIARKIDTLSAVQKEISGKDFTTRNLQPEINWIKVNFNRPFGDIIITLESLQEKEKQGTASVRGKDSGSHKEMVPFTVPCKRFVTYNNITYQLDFVKIDRAGKNPFTKAVYFSVSRPFSRGKL